MFNETLRLYAPASFVPKVASEDCVLYPRDGSGNRVPVFVPKGSDIMFHMPGLHFNRAYSFLHFVHEESSYTHDGVIAKYWENPHEFDPSRFLKPDWPRDAFMPFSGGARSCIGRR